MSQVDKALRAWEASLAERGVAASLDDATKSESERLSLGAYTSELGATVTATEAGALPAALEFRAEGGQPGTVEAHVPISDLDARLVTGATGAVPLEQYRRLAAVLHDVQLQQGLKSLMVTSALPAEGKTLTVVNLALTLCESYSRRVLLIDADLRWPSVHKTLGIPNTSGLNEVLQGHPFNSLIRRVSPQLSVLTAGRPGRAPLAGLTSPTMASLLEECGGYYDWVLLDTPPVGLLPDAQLLARLTRAAVFVIAAGVTPSATVERAVTELGPDCIIGVVLNRVDDRRIPEAEYYAHYYDSTSPESREQEANR